MRSISDAWAYTGIWTPNRALPSKTDSDVCIRGRRTQPRFARLRFVVALTLLGIQYSLKLGLLFPYPEMGLLV